MSDLIGPLVLLFLLAVVIFGGAAYIDYVGCHNRWRDSGFPVRYELIAGCMIRQKDGRWIPAENYREL
jgi:hypothetical protein